MHEHRLNQASATGRTGNGICRRDYPLAHRRQCRRPASSTRPAARACFTVTVLISSVRASGDKELRNNASLSENFTEDPAGFSYQ